MSDEAETDPKTRGVELADWLTRLVREGDAAGASVHAGEAVKREPDAAREALLELADRLADVPDDIPEVGVSEEMASARADQATSKGPPTRIQ